MPASDRWLPHLIAVCGMLVAACASPPKPPPPTIVQAELSALPAVNPDARGRPSPIVVKFFELKSVAAFNSADFFSLFDRERETLGTELVAREEFQLAPEPGASSSGRFRRTARYLGVVAAYRDLEQSVWRAAVPVTLNKTVPLAITLDAQKVVIASPRWSAPDRR